MTGRDEAEPATLHRLEELRCPGAVAKRHAQLPDRSAQDRLGDDRVRPDGVQQFLLRDEHAGALGQVTQHRPGIRSQRDGFAVPQKEPCAEIHAKRPEDNRGVLTDDPRRYTRAFLLDGSVAMSERGRWSGESGAPSWQPSPASRNSCHAATTAPYIADDRPAASVVSCSPSTRDVSAASTSAQPTARSPCTISVCQM